MFAFTFAMVSNIQEEICYLNLNSAQILLSRKESLDPHYLVKCCHGEYKASSVD